MHPIGGMHVLRVHSLLSSYRYGKCTGGVSTPALAACIYRQIRDREAYDDSERLEVKCFGKLAHDLNGGRRSVHEFCGIARDKRASILEALLRNSTGIEPLEQIEIHWSKLRNLPNMTIYTESIVPKV